MRDKIIVGASLVVISFALGIFFNRMYQTPEKSLQVYKSALADFNGGDYSNAYYLFSKVSPLSDLKPAALYRQGESARAIDDKVSAVKKYQLLFNGYSKHPLSVRAKYLAAQILLEENPKLAQRYFQQIMQNAPDSDYAIAAEYYLGVILMNKYTANQSNMFPLSQKQIVENYFRHYLTKAPGGRLANNVVEKWLSLDKEISSDDYLLIAKTLYLFGNYPKVKEILAKTNEQESWLLNAKNLKVMGQISGARAVLNEGMIESEEYLSNDDINEAIDLYLELSPLTKPQAVNYLKSILSGKGVYYTTVLSCKYLPSSERADCYRNLYIDYPEEKFASKALAEVFFDAIENNDLRNAKKIGEDYLKKFRHNEDAPKVSFWLGKIAEMNRNYGEYMTLYKKVISDYPDSYYAYRAYLRLNHREQPLLTDYIQPKNVEFPYQIRNQLLKQLAEVEDYGIIDEILGHDDFVKSWILYKQGDYSHSMLVARNAMEKLEKKPDKYDLRWRLVYPVHYYEQIKDYADKNGNNAPLMLSLVREESYFNPDASSSVGAKGLMQLMPATAEEVATRKGLGSYNLFDVESNIRLGNAYYSYIRSMLSGMDVSAIASYNGGVGSVTKWKQSLDYSDTDSFIEKIPYDETQNYVKKVFGSYWNYIRIYNGNG